MNIYAIRDRLIDYYMQPFVGPDDKNVLAAVARTINQGEMTSDIAQAPHHFEVWRLGRVTEDGHIDVSKEFLADCSSLVRGGIRQRSTADGRRDRAAPDAQGAHSHEARGDETRGHPDGRPLPIAPQTARGAVNEVPGGHRGGYPPPDLEKD